MIRIILARLAKMTVRARESKIHKDAAIGMFSWVAQSNIGKGAKIGSYNTIFRSTIGKYTYTGNNTHIIGAEVGNYCSISWNVTIGGQEHPTDRFTTHPLTYVRNWGVPETYLKDYDEFKEPVKIEHDVWIGANAIIIRGVKVGTGAVIGAGAVVTKDVPPYAIVAGVPAKIIRFRFDENTRERLLKTKWWELDPKEAVEKILDEFGDVRPIGQRSAR